MKASIGAIAYNDIEYEIDHGDLAPFGISGTVPDVRAVAKAKYTLDGLLSIMVGPDGTETVPLAPEFRAEVQASILALSRFLCAEFLRRYGYTAIYSIRGVSSPAGRKLESLEGSFSWDLFCAILWAADGSCSYLYRVHTTAGEYASFVKRAQAIGLTIRRIDYPDWTSPGDIFTLAIVEDDPSIPAPLQGEVEQLRMARVRASLK